MSTETRRIIIKTEADTRDAVRGFDRMKTATDGAYTSLQKLADTKPQGAWTKAVNDMTGALSKLSGGMGAAVGAVDKFSKAMAPWNQSLELAGKFARVADAGLEQYAKRNAAAAEQVKKFRGEIEAAKNSMLDFVGAAAMATFGNSTDVRATQAKMLYAANPALARRLFTSDGKLRDLKDLATENPELAAALGVRAGGGGEGAGGLVTALGEIKKSAIELFHPNVWDAQNAVAAFRQIGESMEAAGRNGKAGSRAFSGGISDLTGAPGYDFEPGRARSYNTSLGERAAEQEVDFGRQIMTAQYTSLGESLNNDTEALNTFAEAAANAYATVADGSASVLGALKTLARQQLLAFGVKEAAEAVSQFAYGLGALANPLFAGAAAMHFASAAKHAAAAGLAGVGVAAIGAIGGGGGASAAGGSGGYSGGTSPSFGGSGNAQAAGGERIVVVIGDSFSRSSPRMQQLEVKRAVELAFGGEGVTDG